MKHPRLVSVLALLPLLGTGSCCWMARVFCGPDTSPWVPISYETSRATLATFLEAVRRENTDGERVVIR